MAELKETIQAGLKDTNPNVRLAAAILAGLDGDESWAKPLTELLSDKYWQVREKAAWALRRTGAKSAKPALMRAMGANEATVRKQILDILGGVNVDEDKAKAKETQPLPVKREAALALAAIDPEIVVSPLMDALDSENPNIKIAAIAGLGNVRAKEAVPPLIELLKDADPKIRASAATALGKIRAKEAAAALIELTKDEKWTVRMEAVIALNHIKSDEAFDALAASLNDKRPEVQRVAIMAVGNTRRPEATELLLPLLEASRQASAMVKRALISSLSGLNATQALDLIAPMLSDEDEGVRSDAAKAVVRLADLN